MKLENNALELCLLADPSESLIQQYAKEGSLFEAYVDDKLIGVCIWNEKGPYTVEIKNIAISEDKQGFGYGKKLLKLMLDSIHQNGYKMVEIGTGNSSINQLAFYQKLGFRMKEIKKDFFTIHYKDKIVENGIWCRDMILLEKEL